MEVIRRLSRSNVQAIEMYARTANFQREVNLLGQAFYPVYYIRRCQV